MKSIWRLTQADTIEKAFNGDGAKIYGGRWNLKGTTIVYAASSVALCTLEVLVHVDSDLLPKLNLFRVNLPEEVLISHLSEKLPEDWRTSPPLESLQEIGTNWIISAKTALLEVPSAVIPTEMNYLINPRHPDFGKLVIQGPEAFEFDPRLR